MQRNRRSTIRPAALLFGVLMAVSMGGHASALDTDFESYTLGPVWGQDGWTGGYCGPHDIEIADNALHSGDPASFGTKSFRISNQFTNGCFGDSFSPSLADEAGEVTAANGGFSGGIRQTAFEVSFAIASSTGALQPGLNIQVSPDRGDGARMSFLRARHTATEMEFEFFDVQGVDPGPAPCLGCANFVSTVFAGYDAARPHSVRLLMHFFDGESNDVVKVFIDGVLVHTGGSWEDYYTMDTESSPTPPMVSRTVDSLLIRASGSPTAGNAGAGFLIDNLSTVTGEIKCIEDETGSKENGPVSAPVHDVVEPAVGGVDSTLGSTVHGINCDVIVPLGL